MENKFEDEHLKFHMEGVHLFRIAKELLTRYWYQAMEETSAGCSTFEWVRASDDSSVFTEGNKIAEYLEEAVQILSEITETSHSWLSGPLVGGRETVQTLSDRHYSVTKELRASASRGMYVSRELRGNVVQLLGDILEVISAQLHKLIHDVVVDVPYVVDHALTKYKVETVFRCIDLYCACMAWNSKLHMVSKDVSTWFSSEATIGTRILRPEDDAIFRGTDIEKAQDAEEARDNSSGEALMARVQKQLQQLTTISEEIDRMPQKKSQSMFGTNSGKKQNH
jgi:hypothetical protein